MTNYAVRPQGKEHIPNYPRGFLVLRILQFIFSLVILGLIAYTLYWIPFAGNCLMIFTTLVTFITGLWIILSHTCVPNLYNYWAVLAFDIFLVIFWLISFAVLAAQTAWYWAAGSSYCDYYACYSDSLYGEALVFGSVIAAASGLGALEFLFYIISLIIHSLMICRHRRAGLHNTPAPKGSAPQPVPLQPQQPQAYNQQPVYNQAPPVANFAVSQEKEFVPTLPPQAQFYPAQGQQQATISPIQPQAPYHPPPQNFNNVYQQQQPQFVQPVPVPYAAPPSGTPGY